MARLKVHRQAVWSLFLLAITGAPVWIQDLLREFVSPGLDEGCDQTDDQHLIDLIQTRGFNAERHEVTTDDGYVLTIHRLRGPTVPYKGPALLVPGLFCSSADFLWNNRDESLGYIISDAGYDVWIVNPRGTAYSLKHINLSCTRPDFWNFSYDECGRLDLASSVDYVLNQTQRKRLALVSHSMGGSEATVFLSLRPEYNKKMSAVVLLAPAITQTNSDGSTGKMINFLSKLQGITKGVVLKKNNLFNKLGEASKHSYLARLVGLLVLRILIGKENPIYFDKSRISTYLNHYPKISSLKAINHFLQGLESRIFRRFDEGKQGNLRKYNLTQPPEYPLHMVTAPVAIFAAENDKLVRLDSLRVTKDRFPNLIGFYVLPEATHADFLLTVNPEAAMFPTLVGILDKSVNGTNQCTSSFEGTKF